jgi:hypothetical protein
MVKNQKGFAHLGIVLLALFVILAVSFAGWKVYDSSKSKTTDTQASSSPNKVTRQKAKESPVQEKPKIPEGYVTYENKDIGFKFAYPKDWGTIVRSGDDRPDLITDGLNGHVLRTSFVYGDEKDGNVNVLPRGHYLNGDTGPGTDEGHYGGGFIEKGGKYYSIAKYTADQVEIPAERILAKVQSGFGTVLIINAGTIAGNRLQLLLNLPEGNPLSGLDLVIKNSNEDFADESKIDNKGLETPKSIAQTFEAD